MPIYMKIDGVDGESVAKGFEKWIEIDSYSWGASTPPASKVQFQDLHFSFNEMMPCPPLMLLCCNGKQIPNVVLKATGPQNEPYLTVTLKEVMISSYMSSGNGGSSGPPTSQVSMAFGFIEYRTYWLRKDGSQGTGRSFWNLATNTGG